MDDPEFQEEVAERIHKGWLDRNRARVEREITAALQKHNLTRAEGMTPILDSDSDALKNVKRRFNQLKPYAEITEEEKGYDRDYLIGAIDNYRGEHPEKAI